MSSEITEKIVLMLQSRDEEMRSLGAALFCQQKTLYADYMWIMTKLSGIQQWRAGHQLKKMQKCTKP